MRYYIKASGSTCYDKTGLTFPEKEELDLEKLVKLHGHTDLRWENQFGWNNQPEVLTFKRPKKEKNYSIYPNKYSSNDFCLRNLELKLPMCLIVCKQDWRIKK